MNQHLRNFLDIDAVLAAYPKPVPRYTSYPTAPEFRTGSAFEIKRAQEESITRDKPVSVYLHIPFCDRLCWFCGCHTKHTEQYAPILTYINHLVEEIEQLGDRLTFKPLAGHIHLGGGSPSLIKPRDMARIRHALDQVFKIGGETEISIELDPSDANPDMMAALLALGTTRVSIGVQDFHPEVQRAINRPQSFAQTAQLIDDLRKNGLVHINIDALYGLPLQSADRLEQTIEQCMSLQPSRMALFGYAHVPWVKKHQQLINTASLPNAVDRFHHATQAADQLAMAGYQPIGIDHFARPDDTLARAAEEGRLHRNFQGYTTDACTTLIGLGCSSIGRFEGGYVQNIVATGQYQHAVANGQSTAAKGCYLSDDDKIRSTIIERLMCDLKIDFAALEARFGRVAQSFEALGRTLAANDDLGLVAFEGRSLTCGRKPN